MRKYLCAHNPHNNAHILVRRHWCLKNSSHPRVKKKRGIRNREIMEKGWKLAHFPSPHISEMGKKLKSLAYHREVDWLWLIQSAFFLLSNEYIFTKITFDTKHLEEPFDETKAFVIMHTVPNLHFWSKNQLSEELTIKSIWDFGQKWDFWNSVSSKVGTRVWIIVFVTQV